MADHHGRDDRTTVAADQNCRIRPAAGECDVAGGIIPGPRQAAGLPQRDHRGHIRICDVGDGECRNCLRS
jgi:hypothetical protein